MLALLTGCSNLQSAARATRATSPARARSPRSRPATAKARATLAGTTLAASTSSLADYRGKVVVVNVWGVLVPACRARGADCSPTPHGPATKGVVFLGIDCRDPSRRPRRRSCGRSKIPYRSIYDPERRDAAGLPRHAAPNSIPSTVVIDRQGRVAASVLGEVTRATDAATTCVDGRSRRRRIAARRRRWFAEPRVLSGSLLLALPGGAGRRAGVVLLARAWSRCCRATCPTPPGCPAPTSRTRKPRPDAARQLLFVLGFTVRLRGPRRAVRARSGDWLSPTRREITVVLGALHDPARPRLRRAGAVAAARRPRAPGARGRAGGGAAARRAVRPRLDPLHRPDAVGASRPWPSTRAPPAAARCSASSTPSGSASRSSSPAWRTAGCSAPCGWVRRHQVWVTRLGGVMLIAGRPAAGHRAVGPVGGRPGCRSQPRSSGYRRRCVR